MPKYELFALLCTLHQLDANFVLKKLSLCLIQDQNVGACVVSNDSLHVIGLGHCKGLANNQYLLYY